MEQNIKNILDKIVVDSCKYEIEKIFTERIDYEKVFDTISSEIGIEVKKIHFYVYFIENFSKTSSTLPDKMNEYLKYILKNFSAIASENIFLNRYIADYGISNNFFTKGILDEISRYDINEIDNSLKQRLLTTYLSEYHHVLILKNYSDFFKQLFLSLIQKDIFLIKTMRISLFKISTYFDISLSQGVEILYYLKDNGVFSILYLDDDIGFINNMGQEKFISEINQLDKNVFIRFLSDIYKYLDLSQFDNFIHFKPVIRFFLSILTAKRYFLEKEENEFMTYYLNLVSDESKSILNEVNKIKDLQYLILFLMNNKLNIFLHKDFAQQFLVRFFQENRYSMDMVKIFQTNVEYFVENYFYVVSYLVNGNLNLNTKTSVSHLLHNLSLKVIEYRGILHFVHMIQLGLEKYAGEFDMKAIIDMLIFKGGVKKLSYKHTESLLKFMLSNSKTYYLERFILFLATSSKGQYVIGRNFKTISTIFNDKYVLSSIKQKIFYNNIFPINFIHFLRKMFE